MRGSSALALAAGLLGLIANIGAPTLGSGLPMRLDVVIVLCVAITAGPAWAALSATVATAARLLAASAIRR